MKKFTDYAKDKGENTSANDIKSNKTAFDILKEVSAKYEGASEEELITAILLEAKKARANGTLSDSEIQNFLATISPMLSVKQKRQLDCVIAKIMRES